MASLGDVFEAQITGEWGNECTENEVGTKVLRTTNFTSDGIINFDNVVLRSITESKVEKKRLRYGDIILEKSGGTEKTPVGRVVFCDQSIEDDTYLCNNFTQAMRVDQEVGYPRYVFYFMWYLHYSGKTDLLQNKTTGIRNLQVKSYLNEEIPLPSLEEQRRIADLLDKVSDLIAKRQAQLDKLDLLVKARFVEMFGEPSSNPMRWKLTTIGRECYYIKDGPHKSLPDVGKGNGYPFISVRNIVNGYIDFSTAKYISEQDYYESVKKCFPQKGDILYSKGGTTGIAKLIDVDIKFANWVHLAVLKFDNSLNGIFFENMLNSDYCYDQSQKLTKGIANKDLVLSAMAQIKIYKPPIKLQNQFAIFVERTNKSKLTIQRSLDKLEILKKALLQQYF